MIILKITLARQPAKIMFFLKLIGLMQKYWAMYLNNWSLLPLVDKLYQKHQCIVMMVENECRVYCDFGIRSIFIVQVVHQFEECLLVLQSKIKEIADLNHAWLVHLLSGNNLVRCFIWFEKSLYHLHISLDDP
jgi:hypothetical protein